MNGQRFHPLERSETNTEQCERIAFSSTKTEGNEYGAV